MTGKEPPDVDPLSSFSAMLRVALNDLLDPAATTFMEMMADDAVMEFPYAPPGLTQRLEGRAALAEYISGLVNIIKVESMTLSVIHHTTQPGVLILEFEGAASSVQTGNLYNQIYISVITLRDGYIVHYRDYWNPLVVLEAAGGAGAIAAPVPGGEG